jgi:hypothetical protein
MVRFGYGAFSQSTESKDTPTTSVFTRHFDNQRIARSILRNSWALLSHGYLFINADPFPIGLGGGNGGVDCIRRIAMGSEFLICILTHKCIPNDLRIMAVGQLALTFAHMVAKRLRAMGCTVTSMRCKQPAALYNTTINKHQIGIHEKYSFCKGNAKKFFEYMILMGSQGMHECPADVIYPVIMSAPSSNTMPSATKTALMSILNKCNQCANSVTSIESRNRTGGYANKNDAQAVGELSVEVRNLTKCVSDLITFLVADSYDYKTVLDGAAAQLPSASSHPDGVNDIISGASMPNSRQGVSVGDKNRVKAQPTGFSTPRDMSLSIQFLISIAKVVTASLFNFMMIQTLKR